MEDEEMEFLNGICKKEVTEWDELTGTSLLNQEVVLEGAVHSIHLNFPPLISIPLIASLLPLIYLEEE